MKVYQIISENKKVDEAPQGWLKGKALGLASKVSSRAQGAKEVGDEANELKNQLSKYMGGRNIKRGTLTVDQLEDFLRLAGYEGIAANELQKLRQEKQQASDARQQKIQKFGQRVGAGMSAAKAGYQAAKSTYGQRAPQESIVENENAALTNAEVDQLLMRVVQQSYAKNAPVSRGKFAPKPKTEPKKSDKTTATDKKEPPLTRAGKTAAPAGKKPKLSSKVMNLLGQLSPEEKKQLAAAISSQSATSSAAPSSAAPATKPKARAKGDTATGPDGDEYVWQGAAWRNKRTGKMAKRDIAKQLT